MVPLIKMVQGFFQLRHFIKNYSFFKPKNLYLEKHIKDLVKKEIKKIKKINSVKDNPLVESVSVKRN